MKKSIIDLMPKHKVYCEPFGGSAAVLLAKPASPVEYYNDLNDEVVDLFCILRDQGDELQELCRLVDMTPYSREQLTRAREEFGTGAEISRIRRVHNMLVRSWFSRMGALYDMATGFKTANGDLKVVKAWNSIPERLRVAAERLKGVYIEKRDAVDLMLQLDGPESFFYIDPPYVESTLNFRKKVVYQHSFDQRAHLDLLTALINLKGKALLSGYRDELYDEMLKDWKRIDVPHICQSGSVKTECLWMNYEP